MTVQSFLNGYEKWWHPLHSLEQYISAHGLPFSLLLFSCPVVTISAELLKLCRSILPGLVRGREYVQIGGININEKPQLPHRIVGIGPFYHPLLHIRDLHVKDDTSV